MNLYAPLLAAVFAAWFLGACKVVPPRVEAGSGAEREPECRIAVLAAVLANAAETNRDLGVLWPGASDSETRQIKQRLEALGIKLRFLETANSPPTKNEEVLLIRYVEIKAQRANARISFQNRNGFVDFLYQLVREGRTWKVVARDLVCAS